MTTVERAETFKNDVLNLGSEAYKMRRYRVNFTQPIKQFNSNGDVPLAHTNMLIWRITKN